MAQLPVANLSNTLDRIKLGAGNLYREHTDRIHTAIIFIALLCGAGVSASTDLSSEALKDKKPEKILKSKVGKKKNEETLLTSLDLKYPTISKDFRATSTGRRGEFKLLSDLGRERYATNDQVLNAKNENALVTLATTATYKVAPSLKKDRKKIVDYKNMLHPEAKEWLSKLAEEYISKTNQKFVVSSAIRSVDYHEQLEKRNAAAAPNGESAHTFGYTFDISRKSLGINSENEQVFRDILGRFRDQKKIYAIIENSCWHITVIDPIYTAE